MIRKLLLIVSTALFLCAAGENMALVETTTLKKESINPLQEFIGTLSFENRSKVAAQNAGVVTTDNIKIGKAVKKGELLLTLDSELLDAQTEAIASNIKIAELELKNYQKDLQRYSQLLLSKAITQKEFDDINLKLETTQARIEALKASLKELSIQKIKKSIKSPINGVIVEKNIHLGEWANAGSVVCTIIDTSELEFHFSVPVEFSKTLQKDKTYTITSSNGEIEAKLSAMIAQGDKITRTFPIRFQVKNSSDSFFFEGDEAKVSLPRNIQKDAFVVPRDAVIKRFGQNVIFTIDQKQSAQMIPVQIVGYSGKLLAIEAMGLHNGMSVVSKGNERIFPNSPVKILNKAQ